MGEMTLGGVDTSEYEGELKKVPFNETVVSLGGSWYINNPANYINRTVTHLLKMQRIFILKGYYTVWDGKNLELGVGQLMEEGREPAPKTSFTTTLAPCWALVANLFALIQLYHRDTGREDSNTCSIWWH
ncbi:hypothetical protein HZ326_21400 [Fusarium oxysporum f. sp. albedinis]|nr:hypothetical protein HZ326_21400 [Fusarium oxysporum f. sp. albedinis]